jgi:hypothetical protein
MGRLGKEWWRVQLRIRSALAPSHPSLVTGFFAYYAVPTNVDALAAHSFPELEVECPRETPGDLILSFRDVSATGVASVCPEMRAGFSIDQLCIDLHLVACPPQGPA